MNAEDRPSWNEVILHAEHGESISVMAHGEHVADIVPSGELDRLRETIEVLTDTELVRDLRKGIADGPGRREPHRLGKPLDDPFDQERTTRRGEYRALYTIHDHERVVTMLAVAHRRDAYRPR